MRLGVCKRNSGSSPMRASRRCLTSSCFTNGYRLFDVLEHIAGDAPALTRSGKYLNDQFQYKFSLSPERHILALQAKFGNAFGFVVFGSTTAGLLEKYVQQVIAASPRADGVEPFRILQSASLPLGRCGCRALSR